MNNKVLRARILFVIIGLFCWWFIFKNALIGFKANLNAKIGTSSVFENSTNSNILKKNIDLNSYEYLLRVLKNIENDEIDLAVQCIDNEINELKISYFNEYLSKFSLYCKEKNKNKKSIYFFNEMLSFQNHMKNEYDVDDSNAVSLSEIVPFYIIKQEAKNKNVSNLCDIFIENTTKNGFLTKKAAIVICLKIRRLYEEDGVVKNADYLKKIQEQINMYKQLYSNELKDNPKFIDEIRYLDVFYDFLQKRINDPVRSIFKRITFNKNIKGLGEK